MHPQLESGLSTLGSESVPAWGCTSWSRGYRDLGPAIRPLLGSNDMRTHCRGKKSPHQMACQTLPGTRPQVARHLLGWVGPPPSLLPSF